MRVLGWVAALTSGLLLAVLILVNVLLNTRLLPHAIIGNDPNFSMTWRFAYSIWPTRLHVYDFRLAGQDSNIQLEYDQARADLTIDLSSLRQRTFRATSVRGVGSRFRMRERLTPGGLDPEKLSVLPAIAGFSDPPLRLVGPEPKPSTDAELESELTARFEDVDVSVTELWFDGFRFQGQGEATGSFHIKPSVDVAVDGHFALGHGAVTRGALPVVTDLSGSLAVLVHQFDPRLHQGPDAVHSVDGMTRLWGTLADLRVLAPYLGTGPAVPRISSAPGRAELFAQFEGGRIAPHTWVRLQSDLLSLDENPYQLTGPFEVTVQVEQVANAFPLAIAKVQLGPSRLARADLSAPLLQIASLGLGATSATLDLLDHPFGDLGFAAWIDGGEAPDLSLVQTYLPENRAFEIRSGFARFNGLLRSPATGPGMAQANLQAENLDLVAGPLRLRGDLLLGGVLQGVTADSQLTSLAGPNPFSAQASLLGHFTVRPLGASRDVTASGHPLSLAVEGSLAPFVPAQVSTPYLLDRTSGRAQLEAQLSGLEFLNGRSKIPRGWSFEGGRGSVALDARVGSGRLVAGSSLKASLKNWGVEKDTLRAEGSLTLKGSVERRGRKGGLQATLSVAPCAIELKENKTLLVRGSRLEVVAESASLALRDLARSLDLSSEAEAEAPDLKVFNRFLRPGGEFGISSGSGQLIASARARRGGKAEGQVQVSGKQVAVDLSGRRVTADWDVKTRLQQASAGQGAIALSGGTIRLDGLTLDGATEGWWSHADMEGELVVSGESHLRLRFGIQARDIGPLLSLYGDRLGLASWLQPHFSMNGFEASGHLEIGPNLLAVEDFRGTGRQLEVLGRFKVQSGEKWGDVMIDSGPLALGFEVRNQDTSLKWFDARGWYQGRMKEPLQQERPALRPETTSSN